MTARTRVFVGILLIYALGVGVLMWRLLADIDPRYRESAEESLVETAHLMAALVEQRSPSGTLDTAWLEPLFRDLYARRFEADIFGIKKESVELRATVVDARGIASTGTVSRIENADAPPTHRSPSFAPISRSFSHSCVSSSNRASV